jgi:hypothetical protein
MIKTVNRLVNGLLTALVATAPRVLKNAPRSREIGSVALRDDPPRRSHYVGPSEWKVAHNALVTGLDAN